VIYEHKSIDKQTWTGETVKIQQVINLKIPKGQRLIIFPRTIIEYSQNLVKITSSYYP
jgi:hypothetical protein